VESLRSQRRLWNSMGTRWRQLSIGPGKLRRSTDSQRRSFSPPEIVVVELPGVRHWAGRAVEIREAKIKERNGSGRGAPDCLIFCIAGNHTPCKQTKKKARVEAKAKAA